MSPHAPQHRGAFQVTLKWPVEKNTGTRAANRENPRACHTDNGTSVAELERIWDHMACAIVCAQISPHRTQDERLNTA